VPNLGTISPFSALSAIPGGNDQACILCVMRSRSLLLLVLLACMLALVPSGVAKPRDGIPSWVAAPEKQTLARLFGNPAVVANWNIPYPRKIVVVWEFQWITVCRTCSAPSNAARPRGRVVRVSFDRRTHRLTGEMRFCEVRGIVPPLSACLAR
jgi:hypothetical protein